MIEDVKISETKTTRHGLFSPAGIFLRLTDTRLQRFWRPSKPSLVINAPVRAPTCAQECAEGLLVGHAALPEKQHWHSDASRSSGTRVLLVFVNQVAINPAADTNVSAAPRYFSRGNIFGSISADAILNIRINNYNDNLFWEVL